MSQIRKGSIVWDTHSQRKVKILNNPNKGELPDGLFQNVGKRYAKHFIGIALITQDERNPYGPRYNNTPCQFRRVRYLIPYKEYLKKFN